MKITKQRLKHIYDVLEKEDISYLQQTISEWYPDIFKKDELEVGKWYRDTTDKHALIFVNKINDCEKNYGFGRGGYWINSYDIPNTPIGKYNIATDEEVEETLIKEAKRRGFRKGCVMKHNQEAYPSLGEHEFIRDNDFSYSASGNDLTIYGWEIFGGGKWATIVETITKEEAEKQLGKTILN
jgi:hypothetical protein